MLGTTEDSLDHEAWQAGPGAAPAASSRGPFVGHAEAYWNANLPVLPGNPGVPDRPMVSRRPSEGWLPTEDEKAVWLRRHGGAGLCLPLGSASGIVAVIIANDQSDFRLAVEEM